MSDAPTKPEISYSEAWCVCLADLLTNGHDKWPVYYPKSGGDPRHWCPDCYDESVEDQRKEAKEEGLLHFFDIRRTLVHSNALDDASMADYEAGGDTCPNGHQAPDRETA